ncbi:uncharacterized protein H6S33_002959 [Morchella sextelata]|uniref:uncharacterized protein n=1 Tax=Morchella sextelata TaxID=1174677 RepID=UPI001D04D043|nr:uncharacterized protein H6S33_002959 [Morchella sextelata]KAH0606971.1 hypothetical protein H6S33_002959 [Morchella sextelata]
MSAQNQLPTPSNARSATTHLQTWKDFSNDLRWMLRVEYTRICEGNMIITEVEEDEGGDREWATWMLDEHWLAEKIDDEKYEEMVEYLREKDD